MLLVVVYYYDVVCGGVVDGVGGVFGVFVVGCVVVLLQINSSSQQ